MRKIESAIFFMMCFLAILMFILIFSFTEAKKEIAKYNEKAIESCYILECNISAFGDLECKTTYAPVSMNITDSYFIKINGGNNETAGI